MFDIGWSEMALILVVALIVIGPKDLPRVARTVGKWTGKARGMAREFQRSFDDMAREAELQDIKTEMEKLSRVDVRHRIEETIDPEGELRRSLAAPVGVDPPDDPYEDPHEGRNDGGAEDPYGHSERDELPAVAAPVPVPSLPAPLAPEPTATEKS